MVSKVVVKNWKDLSVQDRDKFHHVTMRPGKGVSYVNALGVPNNGKSSGGAWYRHPHSEKVFCHEALHLAGLQDRYKECRDGRRGIVDNCKDGDTCKLEEYNKTPACKGYEHDCMGTNVKKPVTCNDNIMAIVRLAHDVTLVCPEECCLREESKTSPKKETEIGVVGDLGLAHYRLQHKDYSDDRLRLNGLHLALGGYFQFVLFKYLYLNNYLKLTLNNAAGKRVEEQDNGMGKIRYEDYFAYRFLELSIGANIQYYLMERLVLSAGPEVALLLMAKYKQYGSSSYNNMTNDYGENKFHNITERRNIQLGINLALMYQLMLWQRPVKPYFNIYIPFTNQIAFANYRNKLYNANLGIQIPLR